MRQIIDTLAQLQRLRDKSVKDKTVELAKQKQICAGYDNNIKALGYLVEKTSAGAAASVESLKNISGYKGTLRKVITWQEQEKTLANIKATRMQKNLTAAACEEKVVALTLDDKRREQQESATAKAQKAVDDIAVQCWLRHKLAMKKVITFGTFDVFHVGHLRLLQRARSLGERLLVGVSSDALNIAKKGRVPVYHQDDRIAIIAGLACVDGVFLEESLEQKAEYLRGYGADILVMGDDWAGKFDDFSCVCEVVYFPRTPSVSTTGIIEVIRGKSATY